MTDAANAKDDHPVPSAASSEANADSLQNETNFGTLASNDEPKSQEDVHDGDSLSFNVNIKRKQDEIAQSTVQSPTRNQEESQRQNNEDDMNGAGSNLSQSGKKITAKELVQHVKNQKKKLQEQEIEIEGLKSRLSTTRARALSTIIELVSRASTRQRILRCFHRWIAFAERESAAVEVERVAGLAHRAGAELEAARIELETVKKERSEMELMQKKLKTLLAKAKQQMAEQAKALENSPEGFSATDVARKVRAPDGTIYCLVAVRRREESQHKDQQQQNGLSYEWRPESVILGWLSASGRISEEIQVRERATLEEELQERYARVSQDLEATLADKQQELDALTDRFEQFRRRAELALEEAGSRSQERDPSEEFALREELARAARERDIQAEKVEELRITLDKSESAVAAAKVREKALKLECEELKSQAEEAKRALEVARASWEQVLRRSETDAEERSRADRQAARETQDRTQQLERQVEELRVSVQESKDKERRSADSLTRAEDRIEALKAAVARAEAKASSAELSRHLASSSSLSLNTLAVAGVPPGHLNSPMVPPPLNRPNLPSAPSLTSPRPTHSKLLVPSHAYATSTSIDEVGDSASAAGGDLHLRTRRDSGDSEFSVSLATGTDIGPKYFVDQVSLFKIFSLSMS